MINIDFDFRLDVNPGEDPDRYSRKLKNAHKILWSKKLPNGKEFFLRDGEQNNLLPNIGDFKLSSDSIIHSLVHTNKVSEIIYEYHTDNSKEELLKKFSTTAGYIVFPSNRIDNKMTINGARGCNTKISDRFDLTLECIRMHYKGKNNPLSEVLSGYKDFFDLFNDFKGYVEFFFLNDLVEDNFSKVLFFLPFNGEFINYPLPKNTKEYESYIQKNLVFLRARKQRIKNWLNNNS